MGGGIPRIARTKSVGGFDIRAETHSTLSIEAYLCIYVFQYLVIFKHCKNIHFYALVGVQCQSLISLTLVDMVASEFLSNVSKASLNEASSSGLSFSAMIFLVYL